MKQKNKKQNQIHFRKWSRKNYAMFCSIGKQIKICVLTMSCSILTLNASAFTSISSVQKVITDDGIADDLPDTITLETALVQAQPKPIVSSLSRVVLSIDKQELHQFPIQNFQQLLAYIGSIDLQERSGQGVQADIRIRGGSFDQAMIMLNGVNFTDPHVGHHNLNLPIDLSSVERVEILQGPGARVLGANAFSGAINIVTLTSDTNLVEAKISAGQHNFSDIGARANFIHKQFKIHASVGKSGSTGYMPNTDFNLENAFLQVQFNGLKNGKINLQSGYRLSEFGANSFYSTVYPEQYERLRTFINALSYKQDIGRIHVNANVYHRRNFDRFDLFRYESPAWYTGHNYHQSDVLGAKARAEYSYYPFKTVVGGEFRSEHIFSNVLGETMTDKKRVPFENNEVFFTKEKLRHISTWSVEQIFYASRLSLSAGAMGSYSADFGHHTCFGADASYQLSPDWSLFASANQALRLPTFTDLFSSGATNIGNPDLKPERSSTFEIGSKFNTSKLSATASAFYREGYNIIDWVRATGDTVYKTQNHTQVNTIGFEANAHYQFQSKYLKSLRVAYTFLNMDKNNLGLESGKGLEYLRHKLAVNANVKIIKNLYWSIGWTYQTRAGLYMDLVGQTQDYSPVSLFDTRLEWRTKTYQIFAEANNVFDTRYFDFANLIQAGRWVKVGISLQIGR
ncbi:MAG: TonB-dependent receptor [Bacteroidales bacterium]|jgi:iron complex outermembrane receptor protein|nr:TonB-dependent receptor [Bacteroidales bacterium]